MVINKPPGAAHNIKPAHAVGKNLIHTGWTDDQYRTIYQVGGRFWNEEELRQKGILSQSKKGVSPVWTPFNLGKLGR